MSANGKQSTFPRGVHPPERKQAAEGRPIAVLPTPKQVGIALLQHIGAPCSATVKPKTEVALGDKIGDAEGFISAPVHASVAGTASRPGKATLPNGRHVTVVPIKAAEEQPAAGRELYERILGGDWSVGDIGSADPGAIADRVREAGIVGLGGAAFPTHVKLRRNEKKPVDTLLINGCECEPYLTADDRLMIEAPARLVAGAQIAAHAIGANRTFICIEDNKPEAAEAVRGVLAGTGLELRLMKTKYPQGGEKQLVKAALGREVPTGGLPLDVGVVVLNVGTTGAIAGAWLRNQALTHRVVTVTGAGINEPKNLLVPIGVSYQELIDFCGGMTDQAARVVAGGPMMGFTLGELDAPLTKGTSGVTVLTRADLKRAAETACVRCGRCVDVCPMRLVPTKIALAARMEREDIVRRYHATACMECGCCAYVCPASIPLVQLVRTGKLLLQ